MRHFFYSLVVITSSVLAFSQSAFANNPPQITPVTLNNPLNIDTLEDFLIAILNLVMVLMVPVIVFFIIWAGFKYVTARGNVATIGEANKAITYAVIGAVIILGAVAISEMIKTTVDEFTAPTPTTFIAPSPVLAGV